VQTGEVVHSLPSKKQKAIDDMTYYILENGQGMANYESSKAHILQLAYVTFIVGIGLSIHSFISPPPCPWGEFAFICS